jgi:hypothetical protein
MTAFRVEGGKCEMCGGTERLWRLGVTKAVLHPNPPSHTYGAPFYTFCERCWADDDEDAA